MSKLDALECADLSALCLAATRRSLFINGAVKPAPTKAASAAALQGVGRGPFETFIQLSYIEVYGGVA